MSLSFIKEGERRRVIAKGREGVLYDEIVVESDAAEETRIKTMLEKYRETGALPAMRKEPQYGQEAFSGDLKEALDIVTRADGAFNALPATTREAFANDKIKLVEAFADPANKEMLSELGFNTDSIPEVSVTDTDQTSGPTAGDNKVEPGHKGETNQNEPVPPETA